MPFYSLCLKYLYLSAAKLHNPDFSKYSKSALCKSLLFFCMTFFVFNSSLVEREKVSLNFVCLNDAFMLSLPLI